MLKTILVAIDGSEIATRVIETLDSLVLSPETKVILCHVFPTAESETELPADRPQPESSRFSSFHIEKQLQSFQEQLSVQSEIELVAGEPSEEIIRLANIHKTDLIIIGSRGLTGMTRIVLGSVSNQVVEEAACSVLVVKPS
ncbi:universal stress protein UspA-like protein [Nostoc sp. PCC 7524]|uniref:universal stress protein n=1 Tax=Nostoc sp. (strain ATCC 29411 / PCC 7524) TaxID=28072 RepID=UPI00029F1443|nr:universal stress protein [Nostoc sp. PCC 7524]AFY48648.1 universal stress protein UspA-like protein [Nostoc sp. PCC 7524]